MPASAVRATHSIMWRLDNVLGQLYGPAVIAHAKAMGVTNLPPEVDDPNAEITPELIIKVFRDVAWHLFPQLAPEGEVH